MSTNSRHELGLQRERGPTKKAVVVGSVGLAPGIWLTVAATIAVLVLLFGVKETARGPLKR